MSVYVLRHGQTDWNNQGIVQGRTDTLLNAKGFAQALEAKKELDKVDFALCYCSPLTRAKQTMETVLEGRGIPVVFDDRLMEMAYGVFEATDWHAEGYQATRRLLAYRHPEGESYFDVAHRIYSLLDEITPQAEDKNILLVCHAAVSRVIGTYFRDDLSNEEFIDNIVPNGGFRVYEVPHRHIEKIRKIPR